MERLEEPRVVLGSEVAAPRLEDRREQAVDPLELLLLAGLVLGGGELRGVEALALDDLEEDGAVAGEERAADRAHLEGPDLTLDPQAAVSLAMMVHELSTNAIKYGALSVESGRVDVRWDVDLDKDGRALTLEWRESGGPPVVAPERPGFGTRLIERGLTASIKGKVTIAYLPEGLRCTMSARATRS